MKRISSKVKKFKSGSEAIKKTLAKLVVDEIGELLVYLSRANYYLIAFGDPRGKDIHF